MDALKGKQELLEKLLAFLINRQREFGYGIHTLVKQLVLWGYIPPYIRILSRRAGRLIYLDGLAGPGVTSPVRLDSTKIHVVPELVFPGSPLTAMFSVPLIVRDAEKCSNLSQYKSFSRFFDEMIFVDINRDNIFVLNYLVKLSRGYIWENHGFEVNTTTQQADINSFLPRKVEEVNEDNQAYMLAFIDPEGFEVPYETWKQLIAPKIDFIMLIPTRHGIRRNLNPDADGHEKLLNFLPPKCRALVRQGAKNVQKQVYKIISCIRDVVYESKNSVLPGDVQIRPVVELIEVKGRLREPEYHLLIVSTGKGIRSPINHIKEAVKNVPARLPAILAEYAREFMSDEARRLLLDSIGRASYDLLAFMKRAKGVVARRRNSS